MTTNVSALIPSGEQLANLSDDSVLQLTRVLRVEAIRDLYKNGTLSGENADRNLFVSLVNGLDSQAVQNKRISADQKAGASNAALMAEIMARISPGHSFAGINQTVDVESRVLPSSIDEAIPVPGETDVNPPQLNYDSFVAANTPEI